MIYFKQYGEQRTGTNYLKSLLEINFKETTVFASALGWKHGMYECGNYKEKWYTDNNKWNGKAKILLKYECSDHKDWVNSMTRNGGVYCVDGYKLPFSAKELRYACNNLNYLFSIKDIYAFIYSFKKFRHPKMPWQKVIDNGWVVDWCDKYEDNYKEWVKLYERYRDFSVFISYENLITNLDAVLEGIKVRYNLEKKHENYIDELKIVDASTDIGLNKQKKEFNKKFYLDRLYMDELPDEAKAIIDLKYNNTNFQILMLKISNRFDLA